MADDRDPQRVFASFGTAYGKPRKRQRRRLSLFPSVFVQAASSATPANALTLDGDTLELNGEPLTLGSAS